MKKYQAFFKNLFLFFVSFFMIEILFHIYGGFDLYYMTIIRIALFDLTLSMILSLIISFIPFRIAKWFILAIVLLLVVYGFVQLEFKNFLDNYYSFGAVSDGAGRISEYVLTFIRDAKWYYWTLFLIPAVLLVYFIKDRHDDRLDFDLLLVIADLFGAFILSFLIYLSLDISNTAISLKDTYRRFNNNDLLIDKIGLDHFLVRDVTALFIEPENEIELIMPDPQKSEDPEETNLKIDDSRLLEAMQKEEDPDIKLIDEYLLSKTYTLENEHTGEFENYNFIYLLVESFDYMAIDEELTPTLYMMMNDGYWFSNHYTPKYSCTTGESEFIAGVSLVPYNDVCTPNEVPTNAYPQAIGHLFKNAGYDTYSFHNWYDQYYDRKDLHESFGFDEYYNLDDLDIDIIQGWQSDLDLIEEAVPHFIDSDRFFSFIITSSTHWPYDESSTLGDRYLEEIDAVHPEYPIEIKRYLSKAIELDKALVRLLELLEENDKLDNTIICLYSDHNPFKLSEDEIATYSLLMDRNETYAISKTPFFMYNPNLEATQFTQVNSTFDQVPTIANLFGLKYDPRLYIGNDIFEDESLVIFPNSDWINKDGIYLASTNTFIPFTNKTLAQAEIDEVNVSVANAFNISYAIMNTDYFAKRSFLADVRYQSEE